MPLAAAAVLVMLMAIAAASWQQNLPPPPPVLPQQPAPPEPAPALDVDKGGDEHEYTISTSVDLVVLHMTVKDRNGGFASGLEKDNFSVFEDGKPQPITVFRKADVPVTLGLVVDHSSSMIPKRAQVNDAALRLIQASNPDDEVFIVHFNENPRMSLGENATFTGSIDQLRAALHTPMPTGRTALYDGIAQALDHLKKGKLGKRVLVVLSDGGDNASRFTLDEVLQLAQRSDVIIYTVALFDETDPDRNPKVLRRIADETGGEYFQPEILGHLKEVCEHIARDVRNQYVVGFSPSPTDGDNVWRAVKVVAQSPGRRLKVRTRAGYFAMKRGAP